MKQSTQIKRDYQEAQAMRTFFPVLLKYTDELKSEVVKDPKDIISGKGFTILKTNVE